MQLEKVKLCARLSSDTENFLARDKSRKRTNYCNFSIFLQPFLEEASPESFLPRADLDLCDAR